MEKCSSGYLLISDILCRPVGRIDREKRCGSIIFPSWGGKGASASRFVPQIPPPVFEALFSQCATPGAALIGNDTVKKSLPEDGSENKSGFAFLLSFLSRFSAIYVLFLSQKQPNVHFAATSHLTTTALKTLYLKAFSAMCGSVAAKN